mmetsp:Transcript_22962/g.40699  ORF Transcript_22962/g.40699 Transcript_22962/m.40699 type:complete len:227 (-) Transcript_22962:40-720(-)
MTAEAPFNCAARNCRVQDKAHLYRIGYCGGFGKGQGAKIVAQKKKGVSGECKVLAQSKDGLFHRGDVLCPNHLKQLKEIYMLTAHPVQKPSALEKKALADMGLPSQRYCVGVAPTSRGLCKECQDTIEEGSLRFGIEHRFGAHYEARWRHWECAKDRDLENALAFVHGSWSALPGFGELSAAEQRVVLASGAGSKRKSESDAEAPPKFRRLAKRPAGNHSATIDLG